MEKKRKNLSGSKNGLKVSNEIENKLKALYYDPRSPVAFGGVDKIYRYLKKNEMKNLTDHEDLTRKKLKIWLSKQDTYTSHHPVRRRFRRPKVIAFSKNYQWDSDTANMVKYKSENDGYSYFSVFIDIFSRYLYTAPMKFLTGEEMVKVTRTVFDKTTNKPQIMRTDQGSEYKSKKFRKFLKDEGVKHIFTFYETKANYAERVIKSIKLKIRKYLTSRETYRWIDVLDDLTYSYNNSYHRMIKMTPSEAQSADSYELWSHQYGDKDNKNEEKKIRTKYPRIFKFKLGDRVKISYLKSTFDREYSEKWTGEIFTIIDRKINQGIPMYRIKDYNNDIIESFFYEPELQMAYIGDEVVYKIEKIIKKGKRKNQSEVLVKWKGWPEKFNSWIPEDQMENI